MARSGQQNAKASPRPAAVPPRFNQAFREAALWLSIGLAGLLAAALASFNPSDPSLTSSGVPGAPVHNLIGPAGAWIADLLLLACGYVAYVAPILIGFSGWVLFRRQSLVGENWVRWLRLLGALIAVTSASAIAELVVVTGGRHWLPAGPGGVLGHLVMAPLRDSLSVSGTGLLLAVVFLASVTVTTGLSWFRLMDRIGGLFLFTWEWLQVRTQRYQQRRRDKQSRAKQVAGLEQDIKRRQEKPVARKIEPRIQVMQPSPRVERERQVPLFEPKERGHLPPLSLLNEAPSHSAGYSKETLEAMSRQVELKLRDFGVEVQVVAVHAGPVITRFELQPAPGVKVSQISNLAKDLARALSTVSVRVVEVIPGKSVIGLEIPNESRELVTLGEILRSQDYDRAPSRLTLALGKNISGHPVITDLQRMPHLLLAGTTGSGKSVALNAMILSLLFKVSPEEVKLILIDPKMLELSVYDGIPHLIAPVVTDMGEAANALRWCVAEMDKRYRRLAAVGVRNLSSYNRKIKDVLARGETIMDPTTGEGEDAKPLEPMPYLVVVIDELADLMMVVGKKVEELIARLAQKARAAGIHLVVATQRPSVDVITGLIKANIPARIAFQVSSRVDSRTILDQSGAESLLGNGDMLYLPAGTAVVNRVHGAFVDDSEVHRVVDFLRRSGSPAYISEVLEGREEPQAPSSDALAADAEADPLYDDAVRIVTETRRASISAVQRRLRIGYNRAARLVEQMERVGIVSSLKSNGQREVLVAPPPED